MKPEDAPNLIESLINQNAIFADKVALQYNGETFVRTERTEVGAKKTEEKVSKVSKVAQK